jgi:crotonobetainyl-CoA:carnitine CoA-transferase CaiB-like acyl-CoA transferase
LKRKEWCDVAKELLDGVKILDFTWAIAGSMTTKQFADHGAAVVRIESRTRPDLTRFERLSSGSSENNPDDKPWFCDINSSKYSLTINLKHPGARRVIMRLVDWCDIVAENFTPGTMKKLGYDYETLKAHKPDLIMLSSSVFGQTGPFAETWGIDGTGNALSGRLSASGWPDRAPTLPSASILGDIVQPYVNAAALTAALIARARTGHGQYIDSSMFEILVQHTAPAAIEQAAKGADFARHGNRVAWAAPHGVFPCAGDERWLAIEVTSDDEWRALCAEMGRASLAADPRFITLAQRKANEDALEREVAAWTHTQDPHHAMLKLQTAGVAAGAVQTAADIVDRDPQIGQRGALVTLPHPPLEPFGHQAPPYKFSRTPHTMRTAPNLGEHTRMVCREFLGMPENEIDTLMADGLFV